MPYNVVFRKTESAVARCLAGVGADAYAVASTQSIISQRDVDRKALGWAQALANSRLRCSLLGIEVYPPWGLSATGNAGGPFANDTIIYTLTNVSSTTVQWSASADVPWVSVSPASGSVAAGASADITVSIIDANTEGLPLSSSTGTLSFVNESNGYGSTTRSLEVNLTSSLAFEQYDGPIAFASGLPTDDGGAISGPRFYKSVTASGASINQYGAVPSEPGPFPAGFCEVSFGGAVVFDPITGAPTGTLSATMELTGLTVGPRSSSGTSTVLLTGQSESAIVNAVLAAGGTLLSAKTYRAAGRDTYVVLHTAPGAPSLGAFVLQGVYGIYGDVEYQFVYTDIVTIDELGIAVARTGAPARTQAITGYDTGTRTYTGSVSRARYTFVPAMGETTARVTTTFLVTPDVGTPYYYYSANTVAVVGGTTKAVDIEYPWINEASVYLEGVEVSYYPANTEDFELVDDSELVTVIPASETWGVDGLLASPPENCQAWDNFESYEADDDVALVTLAGGYGFASDGLLRTASGTQAYDDFEWGTDGGVVYSFGQGVGWAHPGAAYPVSSPQANDDFESYDDGAITTLNYAGRQSLWSADGEII